MASNVSNYFTDPAQLYNDVIYPQKDRIQREKDWERSAPQGKTRGQKTGAVEETDNTPTRELSPAAKKLLDKLKKTYDNVDFMVAGSNNSADAKAKLANGTRKYSVLFTNDELEKMAADKGYQKEMLGKMHEGFQATATASAEHGLNAGNPAGGGLKSVSFIYNSDGTSSIYKEMEKTMEAQKTRIEEKREKRAAEKKEQNKRGTRA